MGRKRGWVVATLTAALAGCATPGTPAPGAFTTRCKDIDLSTVSLEPVAVENWQPTPQPPGFLRIQYFWEANGGPVYAVFVLYQNVDSQSVPYIVGPLPGFPDDWNWEKSRGRMGPEHKEKWGMFWEKLRG